MDSLFNSPSDHYPNFYVGGCSKLAGGYLRGFVLTTYSLPIYTYVYTYRLFEANKINGLFQLITNSNFPETLTLIVV